MAKGSMAPARNVLFIHMVARSTIFPYQELAVFFSLSWNQYLFFYTLVYSTRSNIAIKRFGRRIQRLNFPFLSISLLAVNCLLIFFSLFLPCPLIMKSLDSGILWKCKTNWTTGRQWTICLRDYLELAWTLKLLLQEGEVAWAAQREEHGVTRADQSAQAQASSAWEWPAQENVYWINNHSIFFALFFAPRTRSDQAEELKTMERKLQELLESYGERSRYAHSWSN